MSENSTTDAKSIIIAYLINQYPQPSHTFIRREIAALEWAGVEVRRFTVRRYREALIEPADLCERDRTQVLLDEGWVALLAATARCALTSPVRFWQALLLALRVGRRSERGVLIHMVYLTEACLLRQIARREAIRHIHAHFGTNSTTVVMLCHALGGPTFSFTCHGPEEFDSPRQLSLREKVRHSSFAIAISQFGRSQLLRWARIEDWPKIRVVHCVVDAAFRRASDGQEAATRFAGNGRPMLVSVGRLVEQKGHAILIEAAAKLRAEGIDYQLLILGDGRLRPHLQQLIDQHCLKEHVLLHGWASAATVRSALRESKALVMASFAEGLPVVIMEAFAAQRPVIATAIAGIPELVEPGKSGWLVPPGSVEALVDAMRSALMAPQTQIEAMGRAGAERVEQLHCPAAESAKLMSLLQEAITSARSIDVDQ